MSAENNMIETDVRKIQLEGSPQVSSNYENLAFSMFCKEKAKQFQDEDFSKNSFNEPSKYL